jgi:CheY-like chemotaxis protein
LAQRVLIVDDNHSVADTLVRLLAALGYDARAVYDGREAASTAKDFLPDLAFIDVSMTGFDGFQTVATIRSQRECAKAVLVALTGYGDRELKQRALAVGFDWHVLKPMRIDTLKDILSIIDPLADASSTAGRIHRVNAAWSQQRGLAAIAGLGGPHFASGWQNRLVSSGTFALRGRVDPIRPLNLPR